MSKDYNKIKGFYDAGLWKEKHVRDAVTKGKITEAEADTILDETSENKAESTYTHR